METKYAGNLEDYARQIIELSGLNSEDRFSSLKEVIYHLILAAGLHDMLSSREKEVLFPFVKHVQFYFETKISLKERRKNEKKDKFPPHPLLKKDKEKKQEEKTPTPVGDERVEDFNRRKEAFRNECLLLTKVYDTQQVIAGRSYVFGIFQGIRLSALTKYHFVHSQYRIYRSPDFV